VILDASLSRPYSESDLTAFANIGFMVHAIVKNNILCSILKFFRLHVQIVYEDPKDLSKSYLKVSFYDIFPKSTLLS
jgi:hypothetical protein